MKREARLVAIGKAARVIDRWGRRRHLTPTEVCVFKAASTGLDRKGMAQHLRIAELTVKTHVQHILAKTGHRCIQSATIEVLLEALAMEDPANA
jgi:DNA-binding NarL/FixJ family response regulator